MVIDHVGLYSRIGRICKITQFTGKSGQSCGTMGLEAVESRLVFCVLPFYPLILFFQSPVHFFNRYQRLLDFRIDAVTLFVAFPENSSGERFPTSQAAGLHVRVVVAAFVIGYGVMTQGPVGTFVARKGKRVVVVGFVVIGYAFLCHHLGTLWTGEQQFFFHFSVAFRLVNVHLVNGKYGHKLSSYHH